MQRALRRAGVPTELRPTKRAHHALHIAEEYADKNPHGMVISSSGDGGYHEVVNGILNSNNPQVVAGVLASGNANDHFNFMHQNDKDTIKRIKAGDQQTIDLIKVKTPNWTRYAHSYVGLGITSQIGKELTKHDLNPFIEILLVLKHIFVIRKVKVRIWGRNRTYDSLVFSNIGKMSKYFTLSNEASATDGKFEITRIKSSAPLGIFRYFFRAGTSRIDIAPQAKRYTFRALRNMHIQLDGEIYTILSGDRVVVTSERQKLRCII